MNRVCNNSKAENVGYLFKKILEMPDDLPINLRNPPTNDDFSRDKESIDGGGEWRL